MDRKQKIRLLKDLQSGNKTLEDLKESSSRFTRESVSKLTWEEIEMFMVFCDKERNSVSGIYPINDDMDWEEEEQKFLRYIDEAFKTRPANYGGVVKYVSP
jgi:hypothetical protein